MFRRYLVFSLTIITIMHISCQPVLTGLYVDQHFSANPHYAEHEKDIVSGVVIDAERQKLKGIIKKGGLLISLNSCSCFDNGDCHHFRKRQRYRG